MSRISFDWRGSTYVQMFFILEARDRGKLALSVVLQVILGFLDLLGVAVIGILGAVAVSGIESKSHGNRVQAILEFLGIATFTVQAQAAFLGLAACSMLLLRTLLSILILKKTLAFLSNRSAQISSSLVSKLLASSLTKIQERTVQQTIYSTSYGVNAVALGVLGSSVSLVADVSLLLTISAGLFYVDPLIAFVSVCLFTVLGLILHKFAGTRAKYLGTLNWKLSVQADETLSEVINSYRELNISGRRDYYARRISEMRQKLASVSAEMQFLPNVSKYVIESGIVVGAVAISSLQFFLQDAKHAVATLAIFLAAGTRIAPAALRIQQGSMQIRNSLATAIPTLELFNELREVPELTHASDALVTDHSGFSAEIDVEALSFSYSDDSSPVISDISIRINEGEFVAIVGPSGAGKTTFVDNLLGILTPTFGRVRISGLPPADAIKNWPGAISYVPQNISTFNKSIGENIALGIPKEHVTKESLESPIRQSQLYDFIQKLPEKEATLVGENGSNLSGGQKQRLGIARALYSKPKIIVLDEATSSLDTATEAAVSNAIQNLRGKTTIVVVAHRISTVRSADKVVYLENGRIVCVGSFDYVKELVPDFDKDSHLLE